MKETEEKKTEVKPENRLRSSSNAFTSDALRFMLATKTRLGNASKKKVGKKVIARKTISRLKATTY